jgi:beta-fructofuranosidase
VFADPAGDGWHMLITARANTGDVGNRGVIGHARSSDLVTWDVMPPLSQPGAGFAHLEVPQVIVIDGRNVLPVLVRARQAGPERAQGYRGGGIWSLEVQHLTGPYDLTPAAVVTTVPLYSGRVIRDRTGQWMMMACVDATNDGSFDGVVSDPIPVHWDRDRGGLAAKASPGRSTSDR